MDGLGAIAALVAQHQRRLAGEGGEEDCAIDTLGNMARERRLARAGIAEQPKNLRLTSLQPACDRAQRGILLRRPAHREGIRYATMPHKGASRSRNASARTERDQAARRRLTNSSASPCSAAMRSSRSRAPNAPLPACSTVC